MKKTYQRKEATNGLFEVLGSDGTILKNHNNKPYPILSENISRNFIGDLNDINDKNRKFIVEGNSEEDVIGEMLLHNLSNIELNESLCYCVISSLLEYEVADMTTELEFENEIQWDRLFRLTPGPPFLLIELKNTQKAREFFGEDYQNLQINYSNSIEEMEENEIPLVSVDIITKISELVQKMSMAEKVMVNILYNLYDCFSITLPILWVAGKIGEEDVISAYYALGKNVDIYEMEEEEYEVPRFEMNRLLYLKTLKHGYSCNDQTLPCVNF